MYILNSKISGIFSDSFQVFATPTEINLCDVWPRVWSVVLVDGLPLMVSCNLSDSDLSFSDLILIIFHIKTLHYVFS